MTRDAWLNTHAAPISITLRELWYEPARQEIVVMADVNRRPRESWSAAPFDVLRSSYRLADFNTAEISRAAERLAAQTGPRDIAVSTRGLSSEGGASQLKALLGAFVFTEAGARRFGEGSTLSIDGGPPITSPAGLAAERTSD